MGQHTAPWDKHTLIRQLTAPSRSASPLWTPRRSESGERKSTPTKVSRPRFVESLASSGRENGVADEATCTAETLTKDEWFRSATPREAATAMVDDMVAINDGLSWLGLPLVTREELIKRLQIDGDEVKGWDLHDMGLTKLPRRFWDIPMTGRVDLSGNPIKCQCCRAAAGLPLQCEPVGQHQPAFVH